MEERFDGSSQACMPDNSQKLSNQRRPGRQLLGLDGIKRSGMGGSSVGKYTSGIHLSGLAACQSESPNKGSKSPQKMLRGKCSREKKHSKVIRGDSQLVEKASHS